MMFIPSNFENKVLGDAFTSMASIDMNQLI